MAWPPPSHSIVNAPCDDAVSRGATTAVTQTIQICEEADEWPSRVRRIASLISASPYLPKRILRDELPTQLHDPSPLSWRGSLTCRPSRRETSPCLPAP